MSIYGNGINMYGKFDRRVFRGNFWSIKDKNKKHRKICKTHHNEVMVDLGINVWVTDGFLTFRCTSLQELEEYIENGFKIEEGK